MANRIRSEVSAAFPSGNCFVKPSDTARKAPGRRLWTPAPGGGEDRELSRQLCIGPGHYDRRAIWIREFSNFAASVGEDLHVGGLPHLLLPQ